MFEPPHCIEKKKKQNSTRRGGIHLLVTLKNRNSTRRGGINLLVALKKMGRVAPSPSILHFEQGRGLEVVGRKMVPPPSRALSEGGGWRWLGRRWPSVSLFKGIGVVGTWKTPPSHVSSEGGGQRWLEGKWSPPVSCFERGRGMEVVGKETGLRLAF